MSDDTARLAGKMLPPKPDAYLIVWGNRGQHRDVRLTRREADEMARVLRGQVIPLGEIRE